MNLAEPPGRIGRLASGLTLLLIGCIVFSFLFAGRSKAQSFRSVSDAPAAWTAFARSIQTQSQSVLRGDDAVARRLQASLEKLRTANPDMPPLSITVRVWVDASGKIERVAFSPLADPAADADLRTLLTRVTAGPPPAGLLQPVHLKLSLEVRQ